MNVIKKLDALVEQGVERGLRLLHWSRSERVAAFARWTAVLVAAPGLLTALPIWASVSLLLVMCVLNIVQSDRDSVHAGVSALLRLLLLVGAATATISLVIVPSVVAASIAGVSVLWSFESYVSMAATPPAGDV